MHGSSSGFEPELRASPSWVAFVMFGFGILLAVAGGLRTDAPSWWLVMVVCLLAVPAAAWWQYHHNLAAVRWLLVLSLVLILTLTAFWSGLTDLLTLLAVPALLAATLIGLPAALALSVGETVLLAALAVAWPGRADPASVGIAATAVWMTLGAVYTAYRPIHRLTQWTWAYYQSAQQRLTQAQDDSAALERALADLLHANRQVSLANDRMAALRQAAEDARQSKEAFAARVSHEFRAPLNVIIGLVSLMVENPDLYDGAFPAQAAEHLKMVQRNCRHLAGMIDDVLDLSQADAGRIVLQRERVAFGEVIEWAAAVIEPLAARKGLALRLEIPADLPTVFCDRIRIRQVILNLLSNAARFTDTGAITVWAGRTDGRVTVRVTDTGPGIAPEDVGRIFEPFVQGQNDPLRIKGGTGLGLSISREFVALHNGRIWAESQPGAGTTFTVELPIEPPPLPAAPPARWIKEEWEWFEGRTGPDVPATQYRPRIVVCDAGGDLYRAFSRECETVEFVAAASLAQAEQALAACPAHALVLNAGATDELADLLARARAAIHDTPIIGCACPSRLGAAHAAGAVDYLVKPLTAAALAAALAPLGPLARVLVVDDDPDARELMTLTLRSLAAQVDVLTAADGAAALASVRAGRPDLILLDLKMAGMGGWETLAALQADAALRSIPVIIVSAQEAVDHAARSETLVATTAAGFTPVRLLACTLALSEALAG